MTSPTCYGVDLSGPASPEETALVRLVRDSDSRTWRVDASELGVDDADICRRVRSSPAPTWVGLDAPLSYEPGGGLRERDRALRDELSTSGFDVSYVLPPTMTRMIYLTARGMTAARMLADSSPADGAPTILEAHPTAALLLRGVPEPAVKKLAETPKARETAVSTLVDARLRDIPSDVTDSDHSVAALAAALATADASSGQPRWQKPSDPPAHPHPMVA